MLVSRDIFQKVKIHIINFSLYVGALSIFGIYLFANFTSDIYYFAILFMLCLLLSAFPIRRTRLAYIPVIPAFFIHHLLLLSMCSRQVVNSEYFTLLIIFSGALYAPALPGILIPVIMAASLAFHFVINNTEVSAAVTGGKIFGTILLAILMAIYSRTLRSITRERDKFYHVSIIDTLTGLYNFNHTVKSGQKLLDDDKNLIVIFFDLDNFKNINDTYGHLVGNQVLIQFANNLREAVGENGISGRMGGDEFALMLIKNDQTQNLVSEIIEKLSKKNYITDPKLIPTNITFSYGIAEQEARSSLNIEDLLMKADRSMYCNKFFKNAELCNVGSNVELTGRFQEIWNVLAQKDMYTYVHSVYVAEYSALLARKLGLSSYEVEELRLAGWLHDIGKLVVSNEILRKASGLNDSEYQIMKYHVNDGLNLLQATDVSNLIHDAIAHHHEHYDGSGYPGGLSQNDISLAGRILAIADTYSAMTVKRVYRQQSSQEEALQELIQNKGSQFDSELVDQFVACFQDTNKVGMD